MNPKLTQIPDHLLNDEGMSHTERLRQNRRLEQWCTTTGLRPTFQELNLERQRRRTTPTERTNP